MTVCLVHGNPETAAVWNRLAPLLDRGPVVRLSPPGFGAAVPPGFTATVEEYRRWLIAELENLEQPVDLVGHDWGGGHVVNVAMHRPDLLLSWASDVLALFDPDYVWHDLAQVWQTPEAGEASLAQMIGASEADRATALAGFGFPPDVAAQVAIAHGAEMARCILALYRSAAQPVMAELGRDLERAAAKPGLAFVPTADPFGSADGGALTLRAAARAGARVAELDGLGHWWMLQDPKRGAEAISTFLATVTA